MLSRPTQKTGLHSTENETSTFDLVVESHVFMKLLLAFAIVVTYHGRSNALVRDAKGNKLEPGENVSTAEQTIIILKA